MSIIRHTVLAVLANAAALFGVTYFLPEEFKIVGGVLGFVVVGASLGFLNAVLKPLLKLIALPLVVLTLGLFLVVINMFILWFLEFLFREVVPSLGVGLEITGGWGALVFGAFILSVFNSLTHWLVK